MKAKTCNTCLGTQAPEAFRRNDNNPDGRHARCRVCEGSCINKGRGKVFKAES